MNDKEKKVSDILLDAITGADGEEKRLRAVNAYNGFMQAVSLRVNAEKR